MKELGQILHAWRQARAGILATVVQVKGSAYRRPGARMLILPDGNRIGSVSGGCLEGDLSRKAWWLTEDGRPVLRTYDTTSDEDAVWQFGLGCNGVIDVLLERLDTPEADAAMQFLHDARARRLTARIATVIRGEHTGERLWLGPEGSPAGSLVPAKLAAQLVPVLRATEGNRLVSLGDAEVFLECIEPPQPLILFGAGHDAIPLVNIAKELGWRVTVADGRPAYATAQRFPLADRVVLMRPEDPLAEMELTPEAAVVVMTHNYPQDCALLRAIAGQSLRYLGVLGPRARTDRLFADLLIPAPASLHAPVGLDIGAESPEMIALAIVAEISATLTGRPGSMLRDREGPIYDHAVTAHSGIRQSSCEIAS